MLRNPTIWWATLGVMLSLVLPAVGSAVVILFFPETRFAHLPIHSLLETSGGLMAVAIAGILVVERKRKPETVYYFSMACALIAMGVLDTFHATVEPGNSFVWLHSTATLAGGLLFATIWFNNSGLYHGMTQAALWFILALSCLTGLHACLLPDQLPLMIDNGVFTPLARGLNICGGVGFLIAGAFFIKRFHRHAQHESWLFAVHTVLLGAAGILFELSSMWDMAWWWWHILRIIAYIAALAFALSAYLDTEHQLIHLNHQLQTSNLRLDKTVAIRTEELRIKEERFTLAVQGSTDGLWDWNIQTNEVYYGARFKELLGHSHDEMSNTYFEFESRLHPEDHDQIQSAIDKHLKLHEPYDVQFRLRLKNGEYRWFRARGQAIWNERGQPTRMAGSITDIHDRKLVEAALEYEQFLLETLLQNLPAEITFKDTQGKFLRVSSSLAKRLGMDNPKAVEGLSNHDFFTKEYAQRRLEQEQELMRTGRSIVRLEEFMQGPSGENLTMLTTKIPLRNRQGAVIGTFGISHDITDIKRAEERFRLVVEATPNPILLVNQTGKIQLANWAAFKMFGYEIEELIGMTLDTLFTKQLDDGHVQSLHELLKHPKAILLTQAQEVNGVCHDGSVLPLEIRLIPVEIDEEQLVLISIFDMSVHKQVDETLKRAKQAAEQANQEKSDFLANMSHEIRTPLNAIIGISELLLNSSLTPNQHEFLSIVLESGESLLSVINDILDFSKIEAGNLELESVNFDFRKEIGSVFKLLSSHNLTKDLDISWQVNPDIPQFLIGDPIRLRQILMNLVGNAIKFTLQGEVNLNVDRQDVDLDSQVHLLFTVRDTGIGISAEHLDSIFSRFVQADSSTTRQFGGSGLGLTITTQIIEAMQGQIWAQSKPGQGSTFQFSLAFPEGSAPDDMASIIEPDLNQMRVLLVEDKTLDRSMLKKILEGWGMLVTTATEGRRAIDIFQQSFDEQRSFSLLVSDVDLPTMSGFDLVKLLRERDQVKETGIIMLTSKPEDIRRCEEMGISHHLTKPVQQSALQEVVSSAVVRSPQKPAVEQNTPLMGSIPPLKVLLAEDSKSNQRLVKALLEKWGHTVKIAKNGQVAVNLWKREPFDMILMDVTMPKMDGLEATRFIREQELQTGQHTPIIAMTARVMKGDLEECLLSGMDGYVAKPIHKHELDAEMTQFFTETITDEKDASAEEIEVLVNWTEALRIVEGDEDLLCELIKDSLVELPELMDNLERALANGNAPDAYRHAHTTKAAARTFGIIKLLEQAGSSEQAAADGDLDTVRDHLPSLRTIVGEVLREFEQRLKPQV